MKKQLVLFCAIILAFTSCKKDNDNSNSPSNTNGTDTYSDYLPLTVGNLWIYDYISVDTNGIETPMNKTDTMQISKDTLINNIIYYKYEGTFFGANYSCQYIRDSLHYLVNHFGQLLFSSLNFTDTLVSDVEIVSDDTLYVGYTIMYDPDSMITVPAGTVDVLDSRRNIHLYPGFDQWGEIRYCHSYYAVGSGVVKNTYFYLSSPTVIERRLVSYQLVN